MMQNEEEDENEVKLNSQVEQFKGVFQEFKKLNNLVTYLISFDFLSIIELLDKFSYSQTILINSRLTFILSR